MINRVTVPVDIHTLDPALPEKLLGGSGVVPGASRRVPGGILVLQAALLNSEPGTASVYRFALQFGSRHSAMQFGTWLFGQLQYQPAALSIAGNLTAIDHRTIITRLQQAA